MHALHGKQDVGTLNRCHYISVLSNLALVLVVVVAKCTTYVTKFTCSIHMDAFEVQAVNNAS